MSQVCIFCEGEKYCQDCEGVGCIDCDYEGDCIHCGGSGYFIPPRSSLKGKIMFPVIRLVDNISGGVNGRNWPGLVLVRKDHPFRAAVAAQESWESMHKMDPIKLFFRVFKRNDNDQREFEYMGHEVEVLTAAMFYGANPQQYRLREAVSMLEGYNGLFKHMTAPLIAEQMRERSGKASRWLNEHRSKLIKVV